MKTQLNNKGQIIYFSYEDFVSLFNDDKRCFICGASNLFGVEFNNEHIIPNWILKEFNLHQKQITFPNEKRYDYGRYKIPCCKDCNSQLSEYYEKPLSLLLKADYDTFLEYIKQKPEYINLIFLWLNVIYSKSYFSKRQFRNKLELKGNTEKISDKFNLSKLHHIHCIARSHFTKANIATNAIGTFFIGQSNNILNFDYCDDKESSTIMIKLGDKFFIAVLDDACGVLSCLKPWLEKINSTLNNLQIRELFTHFSYANYNLKQRPEFCSKYNQLTDEYAIFANVPEYFELKPIEESPITIEELLAYFVKDYFPYNEAIIDEIKAGRKGFLFDENGNFYEEIIDIK